MSDYKTNIKKVKGPTPGDWYYYEVIYKKTGEVWFFATRKGTKKEIEQHIKDVLKRRLQSCHVVDPAPRSGSKGFKGFKL